MPHFDLLFVTAYPTGFFASPAEFAATAISRSRRQLQRGARRWSRSAIAAWHHNLAADIFGHIAMVSSTGSSRTGSRHRKV